MSQEQRTGEARDRGKARDRAEKRRPSARLLGAVGAVLLLAIVVWLIVDGGGSSDEPREPEAVTPSELADIAESRDLPLFWAGPHPGATLELSESEGGRIYVRYLTEGAEPDDPRASFLTVGTYEFTQPIPAMRKLGKAAGGVLRSAPGGGVVYFNRETPTNVYLAYPGIEAQIEIYDPDPKRALSLATEGEIVPVQ